MKRIFFASALAALLCCYSQGNATEISCDNPIFADALPTSRPTSVTTAPEAVAAAQDQFAAPAGTFGLGEFDKHFWPYEPMYFIGGGQSPNVKFQFSFRYQIVAPATPRPSESTFLSGFNFAFSQTTLWDTSEPSAPFFDSSYRPEFFYYLENIPGIVPPHDWQVGMQLGVGHESNGKDGTDSRSMNIAYFRPIVQFPLNSKGMFLLIAPKMYAYITSLSDNPDIQRYRGNADIRTVIGWRDNLQLAAIGRIGDSFNRGSIQLDLTYPFTKLIKGVDVAIDAQYFEGYGESLLNYNKSSSIFRIGFSIVR